MALFYNHDTATVGNQLQNSIHYYLKTLFSNYHQKLNEMQYLKHFRV